MVVEQSHDFDRLAGTIDPDKNLVSKLGILGVEIEPAIANSLSGLRIPSGVIVVAKAADSKADVSLATGDVIHALNGAPVETLASLRSALGHLSANSPVVLQIEREGKLMFITFRFDGSD